MVTAERAGKGGIAEIPTGRPRLLESRAAPERKPRVLEAYSRRARVREIQTLTSTATVRFRFEVIDDQPFGFSPGQFVGILVRVPELGYPRRAYCVLSPPGCDRSFEVLVRQVPEGHLSRYLASLRVGDVIAFRGPTGRSMVPREPDTELILLATGVGVGPFLSLLRHLLPQGFNRRIRLFWGLRLAEDLCLLEELDALAAGNESFSYEISLSRPPEGWKGLRGRLTWSVPPLLETLGGKHFYLVGNGAMVEEMSIVLSDLGVPQQLVHEERYFNLRHKPDPETLARLRERFVARDLQSPLAHREALEQALLEQRQILLR